MKKLLSYTALVATFSVSARGELPVAGGLPGDQVSPVQAQGAGGHVIAWQDSKIDNRGWGIAVQRFGSDLSAKGAVQRANVQTLNHQENPKIGALSGGGLVLVWQSGRRGHQDVVFRQMAADGSWLRSESFANSFRLGDQNDPSIAVLADSSFVISWSSRSQFGHMNRGVVAQRFSKTGLRLGNEIRIDEAGPSDSSSARLVPLTDGGFSAFWLSDSRLGQTRRTLKTRTFGPDSVARGPSIVLSEVGEGVPEFAVSSTSSGAVDLIAFNRNRTSLNLYSIDSTSALAQVTMIRQFPRSLFSSGLSISSTADSVFASWTTVRSGGLTSFGETVVVNRSNPATAIPVPVSTTRVVTTSGVTVTPAAQDRTVAVWSTSAGNNGFDVMMDVR